MGQVIELISTTPNSPPMIGVGCFEGSQLLHSVPVLYTLYNLLSLLIEWSVTPQNMPSEQFPPNDTLLLFWFTAVLPFYLSPFSYSRFDLSPFWFVTVLTIPPRCLCSIKEQQN